MNRTSTSMATLLSFVLGTAAILLPALFYGGTAEEANSFAPLFARAIKHLNPLVVLPLLVGVGFLCASVVRLRSPIGVLWIGIASIMSLPAWSALDIAFGNPKVERHNLLPFEWAIYLALGLFAAIGAGAAFVVVNRKSGHAT